MRVVRCWSVCGVLAFALLTGCGPTAVTAPEVDSTPVGTPRSTASPAPLGSEGSATALVDVESEETDPSAADYLGLGRWTCDEAAVMAERQLRRLGETDDRASEAHCFVLNGGGGDLFAPPSEPNSEEWQVGVLYTAGGVTEEELSTMTLWDVLAAGGVLLSVDFNVAEPSPSDEMNYEDGLEVEGERAVLHEGQQNNIALGVWFAGEEGRRVRGILMSGRSREQMRQLMSMVEVGTPVQVTG